MKHDLLRNTLPHLVAILALAASPALAQPAGAPLAGDLTAQMAGIHETLKGIAAVLEKQVEGQTLDLLMKRIQLSSERIARTETELGSVRNERKALDEQEGQLEVQQTRIELQLESGSREVPEAELEAFRAQMTAQKERVERQLRDADLRIAELESRLGNQRADLQEWQDFLDERLGDL